MVLKNYRTLSTTQNYTGTAATQTLDLPRDFLLQRIKLDWTGLITPSGTSVLVTDGLLRCISNIRIKAVGEGSSRTIFEVSGRDLYYLNNWDYSTPASSLVRPTASGVAATAQTGWVIDFRVNKQDPEDYSVAIPSYLLSTLQLEVEYAAFNATNYGTNFGTVDMDLTVTLIEGIPEANENFSSNPLMTVLTKQLSGDTSTGSDETFNTYFQVGALIRRSFLCAETSAGVRSDTEVNSFSVTSGTIPLMSEINWFANKQKDVVNYRISDDIDGNWTVAGYTMIDFANNMSPLLQQLLD